MFNKHIHQKKSSLTLEIGRVQNQKLCENLQLLILFEYNYVLCWIIHFFYKQLDNYIITSNWEVTDTAFEPNLNQAIEPTALPQLLTMTVFLVILIVPISWEGFF